MSMRGTPSFLQVLDGLRDHAARHEGLAEADLVGDEEARRFPSRYRRRNTYSTEARWKSFSEPRTAETSTLLSLTFHPLASFADRLPDLVEPGGRSPAVSGLAFSSFTRPATSSRRSGLWLRVFRSDSKSWRSDQPEIPLSAEPSRDGPTRISPKTRLLRVLEQ